MVLIAKGFAMIVCMCVVSVFGCLDMGNVQLNQCGSHNQGFRDCVCLCVCECGVLHTSGQFVTLR